MRRITQRCFETMRLGRNRLRHRWHRGGEVQTGEHDCRWGRASMPGRGVCGLCVLACLTLVPACAGYAQPDRSRERSRQRRVDKAPAVGTDAPNFKLKTRDGRREVELAGFKGGKPVVLVFGSYT